VADDVFAAEWLELREPADHRARSEELVAALEGAAEQHGWSRALDLGAGTGSNVRYLAPRLASVTDWTLLDHDGGLLAAAAEGLPRSIPRAGIRTVIGDLAGHGLAAIDEVDVVVAAALLDLVSETWLASLVDRCLARGTGALFALSYDGRLAWEPADPVDALVREALNEHQVREKGMGAALGPRAWLVARDLFGTAGYDTRVRHSPWELTGPGDAALAEALVDGWASAAEETRPDSVGEIRAWAERRRAGVRADGWRLRVGHRDLLALPGAERGGARRGGGGGRP
jgi:SAM-dependent methyltransferase